MEQQQIYCLIVQKKKQNYRNNFVLYFLFSLRNIETDFSFGQSKKDQQNSFTGNGSASFFRTIPQKQNKIKQNNKINKN